MQQDENSKIEELIRRFSDETVRFLEFHGLGGAEAVKIRPARNDDTLPRWNACACLITDHETG